MTIRKSGARRIVTALPQILRCVNTRLRAPVLAALSLWCGACGGQITRRVVFDQAIALPSGRFVGPVEIQAPRKAEDRYVVYEIDATLVAACAPRLRISTPDGETLQLGAKDSRWQELLARRAEGTRDVAAADDSAEASASAAPTDGAAEREAAAPVPESPAAGNGAEPTVTPQPVDADQAPVPLSPPAEEVPSASAHIEVGTAPTASPPIDQGHWKLVTTEQWPGQNEFLALRSQHCAAKRTYKLRYDTALDESGRFVVWGEVPQELADASLHIKIVEATDVDGRREHEEELAQAERDRIREEREHGRKRLRDEEKHRRALEKQQRQREELAKRPRPPKPRPKYEKPRTAAAEGAVWIPGDWVWSPGDGKWVWVWGSWGAPGTTPALKNDRPGAPPVPGCQWKNGYWVWVGTHGRWDWQPGHWLAPPPKVENPGTAPVPESSWVAGHWVPRGQSFEWIAGHWDRPRPRAETVPPPPFAGAKWRAGLWVHLDNRWTWLPGHYEDPSRKPPPRKAESPGPKPHAQAVWLAGFWQWNEKERSHRWIAGHWELPPGEGYVWVPDPPDPQLGISVGGRWELRIDVSGGAR